jgi:hypothetical protein
LSDKCLKFDDKFEMIFVLNCSFEISDSIITLPNEMNERIIEETFKVHTFKTLKQCSWTCYFITDFNSVIIKVNWSNYNF